MPTRKPSVIRGLMRAQDHRDNHLPPDVIASLPQQRRTAIANRNATLESLRAEQSENVARVGEKLARLREHMITAGRGTEFAAFRFAGWSDNYPLESYTQDGVLGGVYTKPEDDREAFIDRKLELEGLA